MGELKILPLTKSFNDVLNDFAIEKNWMTTARIEPLIWSKELNKFGAVVFEVSSFVGNSVSLNKFLLLNS